MQNVKDIVNEITQLQKKYHDELMEKILSQKDTLEAFHNANLAAQDDETQELLCSIEFLLELAGVEGYEFS